MVKLDILILFPVSEGRHLLNIGVLTIKYNSSFFIYNHDTLHMIPYQYLQNNLIFYKSGIFHCVNVANFLIYFLIDIQMIFYPANDAVIYSLATCYFAHMYIYRSLGNPQKNRCHFGRYGHIAHQNVRTRKMCENACLLAQSHWHGILIDKGKKSISLQFQFTLTMNEAGYLVICFKRYLYFLFYEFFVHILSSLPLITCCSFSYFVDILYIQEN